MQVIQRAKGVQFHRGQPRKGLGGGEADVRHVQRRFAIKNAAPQVRDRLFQGVLADADRTEAQQKFTEGDRAEDGVPGAATFGDHIARGKLVIVDFEIANERRSNPKGVNFLNAAKSRGLLRPQREQHHWRTIPVSCGAGIVLPRQDRDHRRAIRIANVILSAIGQIFLRTDFPDCEFVAQQIGAMVLFRDAERQQPAGLQRRDRLALQWLI